MKVFKGVDRTALVGESQTIKIANANSPQLFDTLQYMYEHSGIKGVVQAWKSMNGGQQHKIKDLLLHGVTANRREYRIASNYDGIVLPTVSMLGGAVNVQPTVPTLDICPRALRNTFAEQFGGRVEFLEHDLDNPHNFGVLEGQVLFVDGGSRGLENLMQTNPDSIKNALGALSMQFAGSRSY
jgi:hypothetical protein